MPEEKMDLKLWRYVTRVAAGLLAASGGAIAQTYLEGGTPIFAVPVFAVPLTIAVVIFWLTRERQDELEKQIQLRSYAIAGIFCIASAVLSEFLAGFGLKDPSRSAAWAATTLPGFFLIVSALLSQFEYYRYAKPARSDA